MSVKKRRNSKLFFALCFINVFTFTTCVFDEDSIEDINSNADTFSVNSKEKWDEVRSIIRKGGDNKEYTINITGDFSVEGNGGYTIFTFGYLSNITINVVGNHTITITSEGGIFCITFDQTIIIKDLTLKGNADNNSVLVSNYGGNFYMKGKSSITNNNGGGVSTHFVDNKGTFIMQDNSSISNNSSIYPGGGVWVISGTFTMMNNASVSNNTSGAGGGVYIDTFGTFIMKDNSSIFNNYARNGGGVYAEYGTFIMEGGIIKSNNSYYNGGGIFINGGTISKTGGIIYGSNEGSNSNSPNAIHQKTISSRWRNTTAGQNDNTTSDSFWLND